jgi:hypothetical protein
MPWINKYKWRGTLDRLDRLEDRLVRYEQAGRDTEYMTVDAIDKDGTPLYQETSEEERYTRAMMRQHGFTDSPDYEPLTTRVHVSSVLTQLADLLGVQIMGTPGYGSRGYAILVEAENGDD